MILQGIIFWFIPQFVRKPSRADELILLDITKERAIEKTLGGSEVNGIFSAGSLAKR